jgi:outer membrane lipoprotein LolB
MLIFLGLGLLGAGGCVSQAPGLSASYAVSGKAVVRSPEGGQRLNFRWNQSQGEYRISVWGAFGVGRVQLSGTEQAMLVTSGNSASIIGPSAEMMEQYLGWSVPLEAMGAWLLGEPANTLPQDRVIVDDRGRITRLGQAGWVVEFSQHELVEGQWRPKRLDISAAEISMRVVLTLPKPVMAP